MDLLYPIDYKLIGKKFHFFDCDTATVVNLLTPSQAKEILITDAIDSNTGKRKILTSLYNEWLCVKVYKITSILQPYFIVCKIDDYTKNKDELFYFVKLENDNNYHSFDFRETCLEGLLDLTETCDWKET